MFIFSLLTLVNPMIKDNSRILSSRCKTVFFLLLSLSLVNCANEPVHEQHTHDIKNIEPAKQSSLPIQDPGKHQSPINIHTLKSHKEMHKHQYEVHFKDEISAVKNLGHTIQLDFNKGSSVVYDGVVYHFRQLHFHTPAEHHIDGIIYPMEMHIVCSTENVELPSYMVIALLFKMGENNKFLNEFLDSVPTQEKSSVSVKFNKIKLSDFLSLDDTGDLAHHFHYKGSLTTPPYSDRVNWVIYKKIFDASEEQIALINRLEGNNARQIQPDNNRTVVHD